MNNRLAAALADRYRIERELGQGGMATVYLAEDLKHHRPVAIKVLKPELAAAIGPERFLREIETTAALRHPHILPLYDSGQTGGQAAGRTESPGAEPPTVRPPDRPTVLFYVMPYVEGESLRDRLDREKQLPLDDAIRIAREVADALSYAHSRGIVHRDIKPENILLESGHAVVADFGIAKAVSAAGGETLTRTGTAIGTPQYMSPEQAAGEKDLDGRSDLYSLGCVLYEMLGGQPPFTGPTIESVVHQHLAVDPPPITNLRPAVRPAVAAALQRSLAKTPADRFNPAAQFADALAAAPPVLSGARPAATRPRWSRSRVLLLSAVAVVVLVAAALGVRRWRGQAGPAVASSVAVLPFTDLSPGGSGAYLGDGMAETLISALANVPGMEVAARTSAFSLRDKAGDVRAIGRALGVATVLEGSIQRSGERLRVTAQLVKTADGLTLWSRTFNGGAGDIFAMQDEVARAVVTALAGKLLPAADSALEGQGTRNVAAYEAYLHGRYYWNMRTASDLVRAADYFQQAIAADSGYARAWSGLADSYTLFIPSEYDVPGIDRDSILDLAEHAARRAVALAPGLGEAYTSLGEVLEYRDKWKEARHAFERGVALSPSYATAHQWYAYDLMVWNRWDSATREMERAKELDPLSMVILVSLGTVYDGAERWTDAARMYQEAADLAPAHPLVLGLRLAHVLLAGDTARWAPGYRAYRKSSGADSAATEAVARQLEDPARRAAGLREAARMGSPYFRLIVARLLGGNAAAIDYVRNLADSLDRFLINGALLYTDLSPELRADPEMQAALQRLGYPDPAEWGS